MRLLFVCTGNTCRSPLAEALARKIAIRRGLSDVDVASAGTGAAPGMPASDGALLVGMERRLDLGAHRAQLLTRDLIRESDLVLTMGPQHLERAQALGGSGKSYTLTAYASHGETERPINDPIGGELDVYRETADELEAEIERIFDRFEAERASGAS